MYTKDSTATELVDIASDDPTFGQGSLSWNARKLSDQKFSKKMLKDVITMYIPNDLSMTSSVVWSEENMLTDIISNVDEVFGGAASAMNAKN
jgi:hypothetical protein